MTHVFLSFASEDSDVADRLAQHLIAGSHTVYRFNSPEQRGDRYMRTIPAEIDRADVFVVLMSKDYIDSPWCQRETELAITRENARNRQFIRVISVADADRTASGFLEGYDWISASGTLTADLLGMITTLITGTVPVPTSEIPGFRNRTAELAELTHALVTPGGAELWCVAAPPLMGKSWLLTRLGEDLEQRGWSVSRLNLRGGSKNLLFNPAVLVKALFDAGDLNLSKNLTDAELATIAARVATGDNQLFVLDGAELLPVPYLATVRRALTIVHALAKKTGTYSRFGIVIGTRRRADWQGITVGALNGGRYQPMVLTEFAIDVVEQQLPPRRFDYEERRAYAERLHQMSEGLPALLIRCMDWAYSNEYRQMDRCDDPELFTEVAAEYIEQEVLGAESVLPDAMESTVPVLEVINASLQALSAFRIYTVSHLADLVTNEEVLARTFAAVGWSHEDLWEAVRHGASHSQRSDDEIWREIEPAIRRLLFRFRHRTDKQRVAAHAKALTFYQGWAKDWAAGREQQVVLVECLWHAASQLMIEKPAELPELLPRTAIELAATYGTSPMYRPSEMRAAAGSRLNADGEFQKLLSGYPGLFDDVVEKVKLTIEERA